MIVTGIEPVTKKKYKVEIDGQLAFMLYKGELSRYHIREQEVIEEETYQEIVGEILEKRAKLRAMHLLTRMDRTEKELYEKLKKDGHPDCVIEAAVEYVKSYGYIDDRAYVRKYIESQQGKKGLRRISMELSQKGISREVIAEVEENMELSDAREQIRELVKKKKREEPMSEKEKLRLYGFLARRGFSSADIWDVLSE